MYDSIETRGSSASEKLQVIVTGKSSATVNFSSALRCGRYASVAVQCVPVSK